MRKVLILLVAMTGMVPSGAAAGGPLEYEVHYYDNFEQTHEVGAFYTYCDGSHSGWGTVGDWEWDQTYQC